MSEEKNTEVQGRRTPAPNREVQDVIGHGRRLPDAARQEETALVDQEATADGRKFPAVSDQMDVEGHGRRAPAPVQETQDAG